MRIRIGLLLTFFCLGLSASAQSWLKEIRRDHPRLFLNKKISPRDQRNARGPLAEHYRAVKRSARRALDREDIQYHVYECTLPGFMLIWYVEGNRRYKEKALWVLREGVAHLERQFQRRKKVSWFSFSRISLMMGYDWLHADLDRKERKRIGKATLEIVV